MRAHSFASSLPAVLCAVVACTEPQTPDTTGAPTGTTAPPTTAAPTVTAAPTGASSVTDAPAGTGTAAPEGKLAGPYVLVFEQSGGIAGMRMETVIDAGTRRITYGGMRNQKPETKDLTAEDIAAITRALEDARFATFPGKIKGGPVADAFSYTLTLRAGGKEYMVSWEDGTTVPESYSAVQSAVNAVRASRFGGAPPRGAPTM